MDISELLNRRNDISTFVVHLCRDVEGKVAELRLKDILSSTPPTIKAKSPLGLYADDSSFNTHAVCFSETPLEHIYTLVADIDNRRCEYKKYGLVFSKSFIRKKGASPIWYINHLTNGGSPIRDALDKLKNSLTLTQRPFFEEIAPFLEYWHTYPHRDFYWEREWRFKGDFPFELNEPVLGICPENEIGNWEANFRPVKFIDPVWGLDKIIEKLAR